MGRSLSISNPGGAEHMAWVDPGFVDDESTHEFNTIQKAIDHIHDSDWYSSLGYRDRAVVYVYPGYYDEQISCWPKIQIKSMSTDYMGVYKSVTLHHNGDSPSTYPLKAGSEYEYHIQGFNIRTSWSDTNDNIFSEYINAKFINCVFEHGKFIESTTQSSVSMLFLECTMYTPKLFEFTGVRGGAFRYLWLDNCYIYGQSASSEEVKFRCESTYATSPEATVEVRNTKIGSGYYSIGGDWNIIADNIRVKSQVQDRNRINTTGKIYFTDSTLSNGMHFYKDCDEKIIHDCDFNDTSGWLITGEDITADATIPIVDYIGNIQQNGISGEIQIIDPIKPVGGNAHNRYYSIQDAIDSIATSGIVDLNQSYSGLSELTITGAKDITVDGHKSYALDFTADIIELGLNQGFTLSRLTDIDGGDIEINGNGANLHIHNCNHTSTYRIVLTSGTGASAHVVSTTFTAPTGLTAIQYNSTDPETTLEYSRVIGSSGYPAVNFTVDADNKFRAKYSTFVHGSGGANNPITRTGAFTVLTSIYKCSGNAGLLPSGIGNNIAASDNTTDSNILF